MKALRKSLEKVLQADEEVRSCFLYSGISGHQSISSVFPSLIRRKKFSLSYLLAMVRKFKVIVESIRGQTSDFHNDHFCLRVITNGSLFIIQKPMWQMQSERILSREGLATILQEGSKWLS